MRLERRTDHRPTAEQTMGLERPVSHENCPFSEAVKLRQLSPVHPIKG
jgi:hypothetical protein